MYILHIKTDGATGAVVGQDADSGDHYYPFSPNTRDNASPMAMGVVVRNGAIANIRFDGVWQSTGGSPSGTINLNGGAIAVGMFTSVGFVPFLKSAGY